MMVRDMVCRACGTVVEDALLEDTSPHAALPCVGCGCASLHEAMCNGGLGKRYRWRDWPTDPRFYEGQIKVGEPTATVHNPDGTKTPSVHYQTGERMDSDARLHGDAREERHDRVRHRCYRERGIAGKTYLDRGRATNGG